MIDRKRLRRLRVAEEQQFVEMHPQSAQLAVAARTNLLGGVPMAWMTRWPGSFPLFFETAAGARMVDVDGIEYVDFCLGDTGAMTGHGLPQVADALHRQATRGITTMLPNADAAWVGAELARRFGLPIWQMAMTATDANRFVLRFARHLTGRPKVLVPAAAYGCTAEISERLNDLLDDPEVDTSGVGGTLTGNALAMAAVRATLESTLRQDDFEFMIPLATAWASGVQATIDEFGLPWNVQQLGARAEYWFCPPPRDGAAAAAAIDHELDALMHLWAVNRGVLLTPFHNMALLSPFHSQADVDTHSRVFHSAVTALLA